MLRVLERISSLLSNDLSSGRLDWADLLFFADVYGMKGALVHCKDEIEQKTYNGSIKANVEQNIEMHEPLQTAEAVYAQFIIKISTDEWDRIKKCFEIEAHEFEKEMSEIYRLIAAMNLHYYSAPP